ncbi:hypothetical protein V8B97DRAFT_2020729 [Scleroderma yunnanense]
MPQLVLPANGTQQQSLSVTAPAQISPDDTSETVDDKALLTTQGGNGNITRTARKRGNVFTCETCSKVYRHPSCLIKHRWEHTPQWREASKFVLSKHQQVQLLEVTLTFYSFNPILTKVLVQAAAILSHLSPSSASLPEDRSLWPSFLSGGLVPPPAHSSYTTNDILPTDGHTLPSSMPTTYPISSSVPTTTMTTVAGRQRSGSTGPRLHDYAIPQSVTGPGGITQVRPGLLGVPTVTPDASDTNPTSQTDSVPDATSDTKSIPVPLRMQPSNASTTHDDALNLLALRTASVRSSESSWGSPRSYNASASPFTFCGPSTFGGQRYTPGQTYHGHRNRHVKSFSETSLSLPRSSIRSKSSPSESPSPSVGKSEDDDADADPADADIDVAISGEGNDSGSPSGRFDTYGSMRVAGAGTGARYRHSPFGYDAMGTGNFGECKTEDMEALGFSVPEEGEEKIESLCPRVPEKIEEWDGMEMEMEMD